ncbi:Mut7-C ubiquitin/RNAse domain-containing protein [bacterium]|nr:Mut7-C ubiquitin/RNAse domain-containing protein [bacterium]
MNTATAKTAHFRFYEELNDFLPRPVRKTQFPYLFEGNPSVKDAIEAIGVPHTEIDLILVDGNSVSFLYHLQDGNCVSVYPVFESMDISPVIRLRAKPLREPRFILDVHLGKLARCLRMLGFDALYDNSYTDPEIVGIAREHHRIILTRDVSLLKMNEVTHGYWIRSQHSEKQVHEVIRRLDLHAYIQPFSRCISCNGIVEEVPKESVIDILEPNTRRYYDEFFRCSSCGKVFWKGSHFKKMEEFVEDVKKEISQAPYL